MSEQVNAGWDCPECRQGKHPNCAGFAFDDADTQVVCGCAETGHR